MVMDLVTGGELFDAVAQQGRLPEHLARSYFQQLVDGIHYCHSRRVYHRDLKPENLLLTADKKTIKITDFGLSSIKAENESSELLHTIMGSPHYIAPEIITSAEKGYDGSKVDVWASGIILFGMLAGHLPFDEPGTRALYKAIVHHPVKYPPHFSYDCVKLLRAMLQKDPSRRPDMEEVKTFQWFKVNYEPATVENVKEKETETAPRKKVKQRVKKSDRHRNGRKSLAKKTSDQQGEQRLRKNSKSSGTEGSTAEDRLAQRSSVVCDAVGTTLSEDKDVSKHSSVDRSADYSSHQDDKENENPEASISPFERMYTNPTRTSAERQVLMPLPLPRNNSSAEHRQSVTETSFKKSILSRCSLIQVDLRDNFINSEDHSPSENEARTSSQHSCTAVERDSEVSEGLPYGPFRKNTVTEKESNPSPNRSSRASVTSEAQKDFGAKEAQGSAKSTKSKHIQSTVEHSLDLPEYRSPWQSSVVVNSAEKEPELGNPVLGSYTGCGNGMSSFNLNASSVLDYDHLHVNEHIRTGSVVLPDIDDRTGRRAFLTCSTDENQTPRDTKTELLSSVAQRISTESSQPQVHTPLGSSEATFEPASLDQYISPITWNSRPTMRRPPRKERTPIASRGLQLNFEVVDSPISESKLTGPRKPPAHYPEPSSKDSTIFKPMKSEFEELAKGQTPRPPPVCSAPSVFSPQLGEDVGSAEDWGIDSVAVFADVETDEVSETFTPASESSVHSTENGLLWKFRGFSSTNSKRNKRRPIFAPLRNNVANKLSSFVE